MTIDSQAAAGAPDPAPVSLPVLTSTAGHLIRRAQQVHTALWAAQLDGHLTAPQYALVSALKSRPMMDQRSVGATVSLDKSTAADVIARLERHGWVRRVRDPDDGRRKLLLLSPAALAALNDVTPRVQIVQDQLVAPLPEVQRDRFISLLGKVAYLGQPPVQVDSDPQVVALSTAPGHLLRRSEQVHGAMWNEHVQGDVTPSQYALLCAVAAHEGLDQSMAGESASLDKSSVAEVVRRLCQRDWIVTEPDPGDRRRKRLRLSDSATTSFAEITPGVLEVQRKLLAALDGSEQEDLISSLRAVGYREPGHEPAQGTFDPSR